MIHMLIANAIGAQVANAIGAMAMVDCVAKIPAPDQEFRRQRLQALVDHQDFGGNKTELGRALGISSGAYVRQMIEGERVITEKTIAKVHSIKGGKYRGWFSKDTTSARAAGAAEWPFASFVTAERWAALDHDQRIAVAWEAAKLVDRLLGQPTAATATPQTSEAAAPASAAPAQAQDNPEREKSHGANVAALGTTTGSGGGRRPVSTMLAKDRKAAAAKKAADEKAAAKKPPTNKGSA